MLHVRTGIPACPSQKTEQTRMSLPPGHMRKLKIIALAVFLQMQFGAGPLYAQTENITRQKLFEAQ